jgi:hypothetical protein
MAFDFPNAPTVGQKYPASPVGGQPTYTWDGEKWTTVGGAIAGKTAVWTDGTTPMTAQLTLIAPPVNPTDAVAKSYADAGVAAKVSKVGDTMTGTLTVPALVSNGDVSAGAATGTAVLRFSSAGSTHYLQFDGTNTYNLVGGYLNLSSGGLTTNTPSGSIGLTLIDTTTGTAKRIRNNNNTLEVVNNANTAIIAQLNDFGGLLVVGRFGRQGIAGAQSLSQHNLYYNAGLTQLWMDTSNLGNITVSSDYRIKKDMVDLPDMWDTVKALRPIKYTQAAFSPPSHEDYVREQQAKGNEISAEPMFPADNIERWGFIAHELQATLVPSAATGEKDAYDTIQSPNPFTVIAALTKALQEAMARIEALEALA